MTYEVIVEGFVLQVEVTNCENTPPNPNSWASDWEFYGSRELEFVVVSGITYDADGVQMAQDLRAVAAAMLAPEPPQAVQEDAFEKTVTFARIEPRHNSAS